jgi:sigma-54 dependent transcriptional regulator, acetoin dehydrogenase operon transcriptional activator AcoR
VRRALVDAVRRSGETGQPLDVRVPIGDGLAAVAHPVFDRGRVIGICLVVPRQPLVAGRPTLPSPPPARGAARRPPQPGGTRYTLEDIVGASPSLAEAARLARIAAANALPVLVLGESGTGKEVFAQGIHAAGSRGRGPFVAVNCAALPRDLIESELFGYVGGAFSGARREGQLGKFEAAQGGTIFLDEIIELSAAAQASLLRVLQEGEVTRVGTAYGRPVDVRVIAATNRDVTASLAAGTLRQDLYYRLNVLTIPLPPLRERGPADIELLATEFLHGAATDLGLPAPELGADALATLSAYAWPGNVRELKNLMRRLVALADAPVIARDHLPAQMRGGVVAAPMVFAVGVPPAGSGSDPARNELIAIVRNARTMTDAAQALGVTRSTLYRRMAHYGLRPGRALNDGPTSPVYQPAKTS